MTGTKKKYVRALRASSGLFYGMKQTENKVNLILAGALEATFPCELQGAIVSQRILLLLYCICYAILLLF